MTKYPLTDTHCHLYLNAFDQDRTDVIEAAIESGLERIMVPAINLESCYQAIKLSEAFEQIYAAVGIHPNTEVEWNSTLKNTLKRLARHEKVQAIGEIGLDYYRDYVSPKDQRQRFIDQLEMASELGKPAILHCREAEDDFLSILTDWQQSAKSHQPVGVWHSFSGNFDNLQTAIKSGLYIGISGPVTFTKADALRKIAVEIPLERLLIETDAPFLAPQTRRGKRNQPAYVAFINEKLAEIKNIKPDKLGKITTKNAEDLFAW